MSLYEQILGRLLVWRQSIVRSRLRFPAPSPHAADLAETFQPALFAAAHPANAPPPKRRAAALQRGQTQSSPSTDKKLAYEHNEVGR